MTRTCSQSGATSIGWSNTEFEARRWKHEIFSVMLERGLEPDALVKEPVPTWSSNPGEPLDCCDWIPLLLGFSVRAAHGDDALQLDPLLVRGGIEPHAGAHLVANGHLRGTFQPEIRPGELP